MNAGDTFIDGKYHHLWIVLSDPSIDANNVVIVNLTTHSIAEESRCILRKGDHPFVKHKTSVRFADARLTCVADLEKLSKAGLLAPRERCSVSLLDTIRVGASMDAHLLPVQCREVLDEQGLL